MNYIGEKCPVCNTVFTEGDDIVVCPECGTPAHRECWKSQGKCINEYRHGDFLWESEKPERVEGEVIEPDSSVSKLCPFCSARNDEDAKHCKNCGRPLIEEGQNPFFNQTFHQTPPDFEKEIDGVKVSKIAAFVQFNYDSYIQKFKKIANKKITFNWAAFLFNPYWFFFRKLYYVGGIFLGIQVILSFAISFFLTQLGLDAFMEEYLSIMQSANFADMQAFMTESAPKLAEMFLISSISFIPNIIAGFIADRVYKRSAFKNIRKTELTTEPDKFAVFTKNGAGVSFLSAGLSMLGYEALVYLLSMLSSLL